MFIVCAVVTISSIVYIAFRHWVKSARLSTISVQKTLGQISNHISLEEWDLATALLIPLLENKRGGKKAALFEIQILRQKKAYKEAQQKAIKARSHFPHELIFTLELGKILLKRGKAKEALKAFESCRAIMRSESDVYAYASALLQSGYPRQAIEMLQPWLVQTEVGKLFSLAAWAHFELKDFAQTIAYYTRAIELGFSSHKLLIQLGHAYRRFGNLAEAEELFKRLLEQDSMDIAALLGLGSCLQERGEHRRALHLYQSGPLWERKDSRLLLAAGICATNVSKYEFAEHYFNELAVKKASPKILAYLGYAQEKQEKWEEAEKSYRRIIEEYPSNPNGYRALAWMFGVGMSTSLSQDQAINYAHIALNIESNSITWEILSACEARIGNFKRAYEIQKALAANDQDRESRQRRQSAMRKLRSQTPLTPTCVIHTLVA
ncbi:MAG: Beta-barrel assembly-enhancing protease [Chlamydiales bacterium]|nr:Beta-barrel assembly-enhancing protease [Chlamydiales bacterium]MCH9636269.1 Beta-barrel assembly-enhancing protease [Chlamydiales bacterium]